MWGQRRRGAGHIAVAALLHRLIGQLLLEQGVRRSGRSTPGEGPSLKRMVGSGHMAWDGHLHVISMMMVVRGRRLTKVVVTVLGVQGLDFGRPTGV